MNSIYSKVDGDDVMIHFFAVTSVTVPAGRSGHQSAAGGQAGVAGFGTIWREKLSVATHVNTLMYRTAASSDLTALVTVYL